MAQWLKNSALAGNLSLDPRAYNSSSTGSKTIFFFCLCRHVYVYDVYAYAYAYAYAYVYVTWALRVKCLWVSGPVDSWLECIDIQLAFKSHLLRLKVTFLESNVSFS